MALTTLSLAAIPAKFIAIPVVAALALGTGTAGAYLTQPTPVSASVISAPVAPAPDTTLFTATPVAAQPVAAPLPCAQQTWPYIDKRCAAENNATARAVRVVMTPRQGAASDPVPAPQEAIEEAKKSLALVSRDTVLRKPELVTAPTKVAAPKAAKPRVVARRVEPQRESRWAAQSYQVPTEYGDRSRAVMVVRPLRTDSPF